MGTIVNGYLNFPVSFTTTNFRCISAYLWIDNIAAHTFDKYVTHLWGASSNKNCGIGDVLCIGY